ncbi:MAG: hypothetical protein ACE5KK_05695, partial [Candidatus Brocadiales bacterium]
PLQVGIIRHDKGFVEPPHTHKDTARVISEVQQVIYLTDGEMEVNFYDDNRVKVERLVLRAGDTMVLLNGGHSIKALNGFEGITVKQGPFLGEEEDKEFFAEAKNDD